MVELVCDTCGKRYGPREVEYVCKLCGEDGGTLTVLYDYQAAARAINRQALLQNREPSHWRYLEILPVQMRSYIPSLRLGMTPLYRCRRLASDLGIGELYVKDDGQNPSGSLKDRASSVCVAKAFERRATVIAAASTGNAASSLSQFATAVSIPAYLFVPQTIPEAKLTQLLIFGARVIMVRGTYDQAYDLCMRAVEKWGWYSRNSGHNPVLREGKKTVALELIEQLSFNVPDVVAVAAGDGCITAGIWKGFRDAARLGLIDRLPRVLAVQAEGAAPLAKAFEAGAEKPQPLEPQTLADSISVGRPRDYAAALRAARESGGAIITVSDEEILTAMRRLARAAGVFAEPSGAAGFAGLLKVSRTGMLHQGDVAVAIVSGNGLKDIRTAVKAVEGKPVEVEPDIRDVAEKLKIEALKRK